MHAAGEVFWSFEPALNERLVDDHFGRDIREFTSLPDFYLFSHGFEVPLHSVDTNRNAINERKRLRMLRQDRSEHA